MDAIDQADLRPRVRFAIVLGSAAGLWLCYFLLTSLRAEILDLGFQSEMLWRRALVSAIGVVITLAMWLMLRLFDARPLWLKICAALVLALPVSVALAQVNQMVFDSMNDRVMEREAAKQGMRVRRSESGDLLVDVPLPSDVQGAIAAGGKPGTVTLNQPEDQMTPWQEMTEIAFGRYFMMLTWAALYLALLVGEKARAAERRESAYRRAAKAAELRSLRYQVNPHFLFNTLNSLSALVLTGKTERAEAMIQMISTFYRRSLADDPTADVPLREEFRLQRLYLDIEGVRFPDRLRTRYDLPKNLREARVPGMILQPLVENSVKHAVATTSDPVTITISAREEYGRLVVTVSDDASGVQAGDAGKSAGFGIGLGNVRERIEARFGEQASIVSGPSSEGYATHIRLPLVTHA
ncbi:MAG TPA: histidine kinase [Croceibacterium sp.]|nr:histidine kinase [Croceibacterium sp.]